MYETFEKLVKQRGVTVADVCKATGISSSTMTDWKKGRYAPKADKLQKIADYFEVSLEFLMTGQQTQYYINEETARLAQEVFERPDLRVLFDMSRTAKPEDVEIAINILRRLRETENG